MFYWTHLCHGWNPHFDQIACLFAAEEHLVCQPLPLKMWAPLGAIEYPVAAPPVCRERRKIPTGTCCMDWSSCCNLPTRTVVTIQPNTDTIWRETVINHTWTQSDWAGDHSWAGSIKLCTCGWASLKGLTQLLRQWEAQGWRILSKPWYGQDMCRDIWGHLQEPEVHLTVFHILAQKALTPPWQSESYAVETPSPIGPGKDGIYWNLQWDIPPKWEGYFAALGFRGPLLCCKLDLLNWTIPGVEQASLKKGSSHSVTDTDKHHLSGAQSRL